MITNITMSTSEASTPQGVSVSDNSFPNLTPSQNSPSQNQPQTSTPTPSPPLPTINPTLQPTNQTSTHQFQPAPTVKTKQGTARTQILIYASIGTVLCITIAVSLLYRHKRKNLP
jgi:hypothetical protein